MTEEIVIRNTVEDDAESIARLQKETFSDLPESARWQESHIRAHVKKFPMGQFCALYDGKIIGSCSSFITSYSQISKPHTWIEACGDFEFKNHIEHGDTLYDADISIHPDFQRRGIAYSMNELRKTLVQKLNLDRLVSGSRLANFYLHSKDMTPKDYITKIISNELSDPVLSFHLSCNFKYVSILPNYLSDKNSLNYGILVEWKNFEH